MAFRRVQQVKYRQQTENGYAASGWKVYTYESGTLIEADTYSDSIGTKHENPIELNSAGEADIYLDDGVVYRFITKTDTGSTYDDQDGITGDGGVTSGGGGGYPPEGVVGNIQYKVGETTFGGDANLNWDNVGRILKISGFIGSPTYADYVTKIYSNELRLDNLGNPTSNNKLLDVVQSNVTSTQSAADISNNGLGKTVKIIQNNGANTQDALNVEHTGLGSAIEAVTSGGDYAGVFVGGGLASILALNGIVSNGDVNIGTNKYVGDGSELTGIPHTVPNGANGDLQFKLEDSFIGGGPNWDGAKLGVSGNIEVTGELIAGGSGTFDEKVTSKSVDFEALVIERLSTGGASLEYKNSVGRLARLGVSASETLEFLPNSGGVVFSVDKDGNLTATGSATTNGATNFGRLSSAPTPVAGGDKYTSSASGTSFVWDEFDWLPIASSLSRVQITQANYATTLATIDSTKQYLIDGIVDVGALEITVPVGGVYMTGFGASISKLISSEDNHTMFTSASNGDITVKDVTITTSGASSKVYDLKSSDGFSNYSALNTIYEDCTSLGILDGFLQGLELDVIRRGGSPDLTLEGTWLAGFLSQTTLVRFLGAGMTGALYKKGTAFSMTSRFKINANVDLPTSAAFIDFEPANFVNPSSLQIQDAIVTRNGVQNADDTNLTPNITMSDLQSAWKNNQGLKNTFVGGKLTVTTEVETPIATVDTFYTLLGTMTVSDLEHFSQVDNYKLTHLGNNPREFKLSLNHIMDGGANDEVTLRIRKYDDSASAFSTIYEQTRTVDNLTGGRDVAYFTMSTNTVLDKDDYIFLDVANRSDTTNVTTELTSFLQVEER